MSPVTSRLLFGSAALGLILSPACGGGDGTPPAGVTAVNITAPVAAPTFGTFGRTVQFTAQALDGSGAPIVGATFTWSSSAGGIATVNAAGLVTAVGNGTANITATSGGVLSTAKVVTVAQVAAAVVVAPTSITFGAIGKTRQLTAAVNDSLGNAVAGAAVVWTRNGPGTVASVSATGLATALGAGTGDSAVATAGTVNAKAAITVTQVVNTVTVTSTSATPDTLFTTTRTRQFTATARDSNNNTIAAAAFTWTSGTPAVALVNNAGLVTAAAGDGTSAIQASSSGVNGNRSIVVRHVPMTFTLTPPSGTITTPGGTQGFNGTAQDTVGTALTINWTSNSTAVLTVSPATGTSTTATAVTNGSTHVVMASGTRRDSAAVTVTGQVAAPSTIAVTGGDNFWRSVRNNTQNLAIDTVAIGGTVTWTWNALNPHGVASTGSPSFTNSTGTPVNGNYSFMFNSAGTYQYTCTFHGPPMSGTIVVR